MSNDEIAAIVTKAVTDSMAVWTRTYGADLRDRVEESTRQLAVTNERLGQMGESVNAHDKLLRGNGTPGIVSKINAMAPMVEEMYEVIKGKGHQDPGLISRVAHLEPMVAQHDVHLRGEGKEAGLLDRVRDLDKNREAWSKPLWVAVTVVVSGIATYLLNLVIK